MNDIPKTKDLKKQLLEIMECPLVAGCSKISSTLADRIENELVNTLKWQFTLHYTLFLLVIIFLIRFVLGLWDMISLKKLEKHHQDLYPEDERI